MTHPLLQTVVEKYTVCGKLLFSIYGIYKCKSYIETYSKYSVILTMAIVADDCYNGVL